MTITSSPFLLFCSKIMQKEFYIRKIFFIHSCNKYSFCLEHDWSVLQLKFFLETSCQFGNYKSVDLFQNLLVYVKNNEKL